MNAIDVIFIIDIILMFITNYQNKDGKEIWNNKYIAFNYIKTPRFYFDFLSVLGTDFISQTIPELRLFGYFKLTRISRINGFINNLNLTWENK